MVYNHWRLRKYTKIAAVKAQHRQAIEQRPSVRARKGHEVPFGVRAIESGIEVDGVWISRSNTPVGSTSGSPAPSITLEPDSTKHPLPTEQASIAPSQRPLEMPRPIHRYSASSQSRSPNTSRIPGFSQDQYSESERPPRSSTASDNVPRARQTYQPRRSSGLRFSNSQDSSSALAALEGRRIASTPEVPESQGRLPFAFHNLNECYKRPDPKNFSLTLANLDFLYGTRVRRDSGSRSGSNSSEDYHTPRRPRMTRDSSDILFDPTYLPKGGPGIQKVDHLDSPVNDRRSHAAEERHLRPRIRLSGVNGNYASSATPEHRYMFEGTTSSEDASNPFATPVGTPLGSTADTYMEDPPSFQSFVNSSPFPHDRIETMDIAERKFHGSQNSNDVLQQGDGRRPNRQSQIFRKANSGFDILRPGSFSHPQGYVTDWDEKSGIGSEHQSGREVDTHGNNRHSNKLQRKRADSKGTYISEHLLPFLHAVILTS